MFENSNIQREFHNQSKMGRLTLCDTKVMKGLDSQRK